MNECPRAGSEFPEMTVRLLDGGELTLASLQGKAVVLQAGSFT
jgi:peroxiredoxin